MTDLKLLVLDSDDLDIVSSHVQDAVLKIGDIKWLKRERRLVLAMNRFVWEAVDGQRTRSFERRRTVLHFEGVQSVRSKGFRSGAGDAILSLLAVRFEPGEAPSGTISLLFAGGGEMRATVEVLEAQLTDLGAAWSTNNKPDHQI